VRATRAGNLEGDRPESRYRLDPDDFLAADREARAAGLDVVGFWHTHPDHPAEPSPTDLAAAWSDYSYLIIATTSAGAAAMRSWRLDGDRFHEETLKDEEPES
jgi:proteasome lid subunit RPN8/RPN11